MTDTVYKMELVNIVVVRVLMRAPLLSSALRQRAATGSLGAGRSATTGTRRTGTGAHHCARSRQGTSVYTTRCHRPHVEVKATIAHQCAETVCLGARWGGWGTATTGTQSQETDARTHAQLNAGTNALVKRMEACARQYAGTGCELV